MCIGTCQAFKDDGDKLVLTCDGNTVTVTKNGKKVNSFSYKGTRIIISANEVYYANTKVTYVDESFSSFNVTDKVIISCIAKKLPAMQAAIQGGPFLVENGTAVKGLNARKSTYRTFIATDGGKRWCIGVSSSVTLRELAEWLATPGALGNFRVKTALNLDGGSSSAFWCHESGISYPAFKQVRNYLGVAPAARR